MSRVGRQDAYEIAVNHFKISTQMIFIFRKGAFLSVSDTILVSLEISFLAILICVLKLQGYISPHRFYNIDTFAPLEGMKRLLDLI
jgi:hypothetical protein